MRNVESTVRNVCASKTNQVLSRWIIRHPIHSKLSGYSPEMQLWVEIESWALAWGSVAAVRAMCAADSSRLAVMRLCLVKQCANTIKM